MSKIACSSGTEQHLWRVDVFRARRAQGKLVPRNERREKTRCQLDGENRSQISSNFAANL